MPQYSVMDDIPSGYSLGGTEYDPVSSYWAFKGLFALCDSLGELKGLQEIWRHYEKQSVEELSELNKTLKRMYRKNKRAAINLAKRYSTGISDQTIGIANKERNRIMTKATKKMTMYDIESATG